MKQYIKSMLVLCESYRIERNRILAPMEIHLSCDKNDGEPLAAFTSKLMCKKDCDECGTNMFTVQIFTRE